MPIPRASTFSDEVTLNITCDVIEPPMQGLRSRSRSIAKSAEAYLKSSGIGDVAYFGPEPEFFNIDSVTWNVDMSGCFVKISSEEAPCPPARNSKAATWAIVRQSRADISRSRCRFAAGHPQCDVPGLEQQGVE